MAGHGEEEYRDLRANGQVRSRIHHAHATGFKIGCPDAGAGFHPAWHSKIALRPHVHRHCHRH